MELTEVKYGSETWIDKDLVNGHKLYHNGKVYNVNVGYRDDVYIYTVDDRIVVYSVNHSLPYIALGVYDIGDPNCSDCELFYQEYNCIEFLEHMGLDLESDPIDIAQDMFNTFEEFTA